MKLPILITFATLSASAQPSLPRAQATVTPIYNPTFTQLPGGTNVLLISTSTSLTQPTLTINHDTNAIGQTFHIGSNLVGESFSMGDGYEGISNSSFTLPLGISTVGINTFTTNGVTNSTFTITNNLVQTFTLTNLPTTVIEIDSSTNIKGPWTTDDYASMLWAGNSWNADSNGVVTGFVTVTETNQQRMFYRVLVSGTNY